MRLKIIEPDEQPVSEELEIFTIDRHSGLIRRRRGYVVSRGDERTVVKARYNVRYVLGGSHPDAWLTFEEAKAASMAEAKRVYMRFTNMAQAASNRHNMVGRQKIPL